MGRKRLPEGEKLERITITLQGKVMDRIAQEGNPKTVIEKILNEKFKIANE